MIKEMSNIHHYPRRDLDFIGIHIKDFVLDKFHDDKFGWSIDIHSLKPQRLVNKAIDPGNAHYQLNSVSWNMEEAFYIELYFEYIYILGALPFVGAG